MRLRLRLRGLTGGEPEPVLDGISLPVVVEVGENVNPPAPLGDPARPGLELALGVVTVAAAAPVVEADERPVGRELVCLERPLRVVADHERDPVLPQESVDVPGEPAGMAELEAVPTGRQPLERDREPLVVPAERLRQLPEAGPHL